MGYREDLVKKTVKGINQTIVVIDKKFVFPNNLNLILKENIDLNSIYDYSFVGNDGVEYLKCNNDSADSIIMYDTKSQPLCRIKDSNSVEYSQNIFREESEDKEDRIARIKDKDSTVACKYSIEFTNFLTERKEVFDMNCDMDYRACGIFYGKEKEGAPMICKIERNLYFYNLYRIEIASGIDIAFIGAVLCFFMKKSFKKYLEGLSINPVNYISDVCCRPLEKPSKEVFIIDPKYVFNYPQVYTVIRDKKVFDEFKILNALDNNKKMYYTEESIDKLVLYDFNSDEPIVNLSETANTSIKRKIYLGKKNDQQVGYLTTLSSNIINKLLVKYTDLETQKYASYIMNSDINYYVCNILYDDEDGNGILVGKIIKDQYEKRTFRIEIAPGVDSIALLAVGLYYAKKSYSYFDKHTSPEEEAKIDEFANKMKNLFGK